MDTEIIKEMLPYISFLGAFYTIMKYGAKTSRSVIDKWKVQEIDLGDIFDEITRGSLNTNTYISTEGFLLKYGQIFKPYSYLNSVWSPTTDKDVKEINNKNPLHQCKKEDLLFERERLWLPTQVIPHLSNIGCAFIYDSRFNGFTCNKDLSKSNNNNLLVEDNKYAKPILVLYDLKKHSQYINKKVSIKGKIIEVPSDISSLLNILPDNDIWEICSNFYRPKNESDNMICLSLLEDSSKIDFVDNYELYQNFDKLSIPLFVETKLDKLKNLNDETTKQLINSILPNTAAKINPLFENQILALHDEGEDAISFPSTNKIHVTYKNPGIVGFYTTTSLVDTEKYSSDLDDLSRYINNFAIDYKNLSKKHFGKSDKLNVTFLFDYNKKDLFRSRNSNISFYDEGQFNNGKSEVSNIIQWLEKNGK
ncbi:hypothetical protein KPL47_08940 [Clostridium estertheticum]|uniref:hypothetical protein n=1 Tax=Clostridium estertheticum TaxID=238834 RepID=UPI001C0BEE5A|nr:hypothetical protein [Clostridium estertheticum]MBU3176498.1 hypothetical protein [Clostridium estertheticum]